ncbi:hypothetical protein HG536_0F04600 [Torulaspora globosa]|uniref:Peroxisome assembly protein 22 n=1 Tax=Torulaspora globosa TaxID=48254 RepID=A0A7G3ZKU8_9SACH|nr:uncharacterized protein HG536_0F04600 [Torulaspora globosa]QLL34134.1 hypothetical protein HG536_0F04600 [Torulaspora globosa]
MRSRDHSRRLLGVVGAISAVCVTGGLIAYWALSPSTSDGSKQERRGSRCILVTKTIADSNKINWESLLKEDVVLVVVPGVMFLHQSYKVIRCSTMSGLWSCVRHLKKKQLLLKPDDLETSMPADVPRYVGQVIHIASELDLAD